MEDDQNRRRPKPKTTKIEDEQIGQRPKWKRTKRRRPKRKTTKMEDDLREDDQNGR